MNSPMRAAPAFLCGGLFVLTAILYAGADRLDGGESADYDWSGPPPAAYGNNGFAQSLLPASPRV